MIKQNTTQNTIILIYIEKLIRFIPHIYLIFRTLVRHTNYFENDFFYLKKIFRDRKINIIDVGASDGISAQFFIKNLNPKYIFCYEPQKIFFKKLVNLKKKHKMLKIFNYGLGEKNTITNIFFPYIKFFQRKYFLLTYSFPIKKELEKQINLDFFIKPKITKSHIIIKKFKITKDKIDLIKIDTNGSEIDIVKSLKLLIKRDKPVLIIENNNIGKIYRILKIHKYKKYCIVNKKFVIHKNQNNANIIFK